MFYKITTTLKKTVTDMDDLSKNSLRIAEAIFEESEDDAFVQILAVEGLEVVTLASIGLRTELNGKMESTVAEYYQRCGMDVAESMFEPLSVKNFIREVRVSSKFYEFDRPNKRKNRQITESDVFNDLLPSYSERYIDTDDFLIREKYADMKVLSLRHDLAQEKARIYAVSSVPSQGHPVHYLVVSSQGRTAYDATCQLTYHLHDQKRLVHNHLVELGFMNRTPVYLADLEPSYFSLKSILKRVAQGSAVFFTVDESFFAELSRNLFDAITDQLTQEILEARHQTLFFLWTTDKAGRATTKILEKLATMSFVEINENELTWEEAVSEMAILLEEKLLDKAIATELLPRDQTSFRPIDITLAFNDWFDQHLRNTTFPQYSTMTPFAQKQKEEIQGSAYQELQAMIGLEDAKAMIDRFIAAHQLHKRREALGMKVPTPSRHCAFMGSPGTAKTTVARLFGRILKENGILPVGDFFEVSRAQLVERYVGWTARNVRKHINAAKGSVLFIDEAYALVDGREGSFGDEAIAELVASMENNLDEVVIIFAGYKDQMEQFLQRNPGLRSRTSYMMEFKDYTVSQLTDIVLKMANDRGFQLPPEARERITKLMQEAIHKKDFGNGRFARNLIEHAIMVQGVRLFKAGLDEVSPDDMRTLLAYDFPEPENEVVECREAYRNPAKRFS